MMRALWAVVVVSLLAVFAVSACDRGGPNDRGTSGDRSPGESGKIANAGASAAAQSANPAQATRLDTLSSEGMPAGFTFALEPKPFVFPRDHGPHPEFRHEWWYVTGHLDAKTGERFGFELTFFRFALTPPPTAEARATPARAATEDAAEASADGEGRMTLARAATDGAAEADALGEARAAAPRSAWRTRQIYMAHFAVTDIDRGTFQSTERFARDALELAGARAEPFRVWLDDWSLGTPSGETGPEGSSYWQLRAADKGYDFDLQLRSVTPPVLNGEAGLSRKADAPGAASYYYSMPRLAAAGRITRDGRALEVDGLAWLDREWGSGALGSDQQGWDWFALQLDDGSTLMFYALRKRDGQRDPHSAGTWFAPDGTTRPLLNDDVEIEAKDFWSSPRGGRYPARWQLRVPSLQLDVDIRPRLADQELDTNPRYWEGAATITGNRANKPVSGRAYVELVGYANSAAR